MAWGALAKGLMGAGKVATRAAGGGARMAGRMFRRKGGKDAPKNPQQAGVGGEERGGALMVRPSSALVPLAVGAGAASASASASTSGGNPNDNVEEVAIRIKTNLIDVKKLLEGTYAYREKVKQEDRKALENAKRSKREDQIETKDTKKNKFKLPVPKEVLSFWEKIKRFFMIFFVSAFLGQIMKLKGPLMKVVKVLAKVVDIAINIAGWVLNIAVSIVDGLYKMVDGLRGLVKNIFGEKGLEMFDTFLGWVNKVVNAAIIAATIISVVAAKMAASSWAALFAKGAAATTTAATATGGAAATAGGIGTGAAVGIVAGTGLLASGLGEGAFQIKKKGQEAEADWFRRYKEKKWYDPRKAVDWGILQIMKAFNFITGTIGVALDIIGAPFRYLIELVRYPFLDEAGKAKQRENLAKFDARIREQFREIVNAFSLGLLAKDKGAFGSIYGKEGTDAMGYTKDGKTKSQQLPAKKGKILLGTPDLVATQDLLLGKPSGQKVHTILKMTSETAEGKEEDMTSELNKPKGLWRGITGVADFMTLGMFDFDQRNRKGAPKDFGIRRIAGGLADYATLGITDFDKRGAGVMQVDPMFGGKDKAWGSRNEQAKRGEKQSGFGLKRGIGGLLDFATLGMFDFDKQNRRGAPKGFGIKRIVGGLADVITGGATDFDKRGTGIGQIKLGEMMSNKKRREAYENNPRVRNFREKRSNLSNKFNQIPMETTTNPDGSITSRGSGKLIGGELFTPGQALTERQYQAVQFGRMMDPNKKYDEDVLRSYAMYEQGASANSNIIIMKQQTTTPVMVGGNDGGTLIIEDSAVASDDSESYASYQGH